MYSTLDMEKAMFRAAAAPQFVDSRLKCMRVQGNGDSQRRTNGHKGGKQGGDDQLFGGNGFFRFHKDPSEFYLPPL